MLRTSCTQAVPENREWSPRAYRGVRIRYTYPDGWSLRNVLLLLSMSRREGIVLALGLAFAVFVVDQGIKAVVEGWMLVAGEPSAPSRLGCGLILGGAAGNLLDRLSTGEVTDYVHFSFWYIFNAADAAITVGVVLLLLSTLWPESTPRTSAVGDPKE